MTNLQSPISSPCGYLLGHILHFGQMLRLMGVAVSLRQVLDLVEATAYVPIAEQLNFYCAARALLVNRREGLPVFDQAFELFWRSISSPQSGQKDNSQAKRAIARLEQLAEVLSDVRLNRPERRQRRRLPPETEGATPASNTLKEHPFAQVVAEYPWLKLFAGLGKLNNGQR